MTDDISKVELKLLQDVVSNILWPNGGTYAEEVQAIIDRLQSATTPAEVDAVTEGGGMDAGAWAELHRLRAEAIESVSGLPWRQLAAQLRVERTTLASQLAEAKAEAAELRRTDRKRTGEYRARAEQAESQLAEATRRLGEVEGLLREWSSWYAGDSDWIETLLARTDAALTKEPTK